MRTGFVWEDFKHPKLKQLKERCGLEEVVFSGRDKFEKQLLLKDWVFKKLPFGYNNTSQYTSALEVLRDKNNAGGFNCTWYVLVFLQCAQALGWYVRKLGIDTDHGFGEKEMRHTVVDIWSDRYKKWFVIDPMFNVHFESDGVPLNAYEIRKCQLTGKRIDKVFGVYGNGKVSGKVKERNDYPANYFWFFILLRNNYIANPNIYDSKALLWVDKYTRTKTWSVGGEHKGKFRRHPMYDGAFVKSNDYALFYPEIK